MQCQATRKHKEVDSFVKEAARIMVSKYGYSDGPARSIVLERVCHNVHDFRDPATFVEAYITYKQEVFAAELKFKTAIKK